MTSRRWVIVGSAVVLIAISSVLLYLRAQDEKLTNKFRAEAYKALYVGERLEDAAEGSREHELDDLSRIMAATHAASATKKDHQLAQNLDLWQAVLQSYVHHSDAAKVLPLTATADQVKAWYGNQDRTLKLVLDEQNALKKELN